MREQAFIDIAPGFVDTGASPNETKPIFSAYVPPAPKKRHKIERTRYRDVASRRAPRFAESARSKKKKNRRKEEASQRPGKKEKIRFGQAPRETLPPAVNSANGTENGGAMPESAYNSLMGIGAPQASPSPERKVRYWDLARQDKEKGHKEKKHKKKKGQQQVPFTPAPPTAAEVAARATQSAPLGLGGNTVAKKKKKEAYTGKKIRYSQVKKKKKVARPLEPTPVPPVRGAPAPASPPAQ
jgi:peptidyl-prolyl cis-trans isomerase SurA